MPDITFTLTDGFGSGGKKRKLSLQPASIREDDGKLVLAGPSRDFFGEPGVPRVVEDVSPGLWKVGELGDSNSYRDVLIDIPDSDTPVDIMPLVLAELAFPQNTTVQTLAQAVATFVDEQNLLADPSGGEAGQVLMKTLGGTEWSTVGDVDLTQLPITLAGDSLAANFHTTRWAGLMTALGRSSSTSRNAGIGSQKTDQIAARWGGKPAAVSAAVTIPAAATAVAVTLSVDVLQGTGVATGATRSVPAVIMGVAGTLTATNPGTTPWTYTFTRAESGFAVAVPAGTPVQTGFTFMDSLPIFWCTRNSVLLAGAATDIPILIEYMLKRSKFRQYALIFSAPPIYASEANGAANRTTLDAVNAAVRDAFPFNYVDAAAWVRDPNVITALGFTLTSQDTTDIGNGLTPTQLTSDGLHLNDTGYTVLTALIVREYQARGLLPAAAVPPSPPTITTASLPAATKNTAYSQALAATGTTPITWTVTSGTLPAGLTLSSDGVLSGTPTATGTATVTITATNSAGTSSKSLTITVAAAYTVITSDGFSGDGNVYGGGGANRTTDATLGGTGKAYVLGSNTHKFATSGGQLMAGAAPAFSPIGVTTAVDNVRASIKVATIMTSITATTPYVQVDAARSIIGTSGVTSLGIRITQAATSQALGARLYLVDSGGTPVQSAASTTVVAGDKVGVSTHWDGSTCTVAMWLNGVVVDTLTYTGTKPNALATLTAGHATDTAWRLDEFIVEQEVA